MRSIISALFLVLIILAANLAYAYLPYDIIQITDNDYDDLYPRINNNGDIVWEGGILEEYREIYFYDGSITQITNNDYRDNGAYINDNGYIVWSGGIPPVTNNLFLYNGSTTTQITHDEYYVGSGSINNNNDMAWSVRGDGIYYYPWGGSVIEVTNVGANAGPQINDSGTIVYHKNPGGDGSSLEIYKYNGTNEENISNRGGQDTYPEVNVNEEVVWQAWQSGKFEVLLYDGSDVTQITNNLLSNEIPRINDNGQIVWFAAEEIYIYDNGSSWAITNNDVKDWYADINNEGIITWAGFDGNDYEIYMGKPVPEPSGLLLLAIGLISMLKRRKR